MIIPHKRRLAILSGDIITMLLAIKLATYVVTFLFSNNKEDIDIFLLSKSATAIDISVWKTITH